MTPTAKQPLLVADLKIGDVYQCRISFNKILIKEITRGGTMTAQGLAGGITEKLGMYYNIMSGKYEWINPEDFQLTEL